MRVRVPDVAILGATLPQEAIVTQPPVAVFEVLNPEDRMQRMMRKPGDYEVMGIPAIWVINPETGVSFRCEDGQMVRREEFFLPERGMVFPLSGIADRVR